jgi:hypothetical protein
VRNTLWAEDGMIFLTQRNDSGSFVNWLTPYQGYLHLVPRMIADFVATFLPVGQYAHGMTALSVLVVGAVGALVFVLSRQIVPWAPARIFMAAVVALNPTAPIEVLGNTANLHWYLLWLAPWLLMYRPNSRLAAWLLGFVALAIALTEIQVIIFLPLIAWRFRQGRMWFVRIGFLVGIAGQILATIVSPRDSGSTVLPSVTTVVWAYLAQSFLSIWTGSSHIAAEVMSYGGFPILVLASLPVLAAAFYVFWRGTPEQRVMAIALFGSATVCFSASYALNVASLFDYSAYSQADWLKFFFFRYSVLPSILLSGIGLIAVSILHTRGVRVIPWLMLALTLTISMAQFVPEGTARTAWTPWFVELGIAQEVCASPDAPSKYSIPISPGRQWVTTLSCETILSR